MNEDHDHRETDWLFNRMNALEEQMREQHQRLRSDMNAGFEKVSHDLRQTVISMTPTCRAHGERLLVIETERGIEKSQALKRGTWAGLAAASGFTILWEVIKRKSGWGL